jgi:transcriptional regulator with XRE-family HTH domain
MAISAFTAAPIVHRVLRGAILMSVHEVFAENLRRKCAEYNSIAEVCSGIGINRQQFNKYLAGSAFPNALTLRKICSFLNVSEQSLFLNGPTAASAANSTNREPALIDGPFGFLSRAEKNYDFGVSDLQNGAYYCYFPMPRAPGIVLRSLVIVRRNRGNATFVRLTVFQSSGKLPNYLAMGKHRGTVFGNDTELYFLGINHHAPRQVSLMTIERANSSSNKFFTGVILTRSGSDLISSRLCLIYQDQKKSTRQMIKELGFVHQSDANLEPVVSATLFGEMQTLFG